MLLFLIPNSISRVQKGICATATVCYWQEEQGHAEDEGIWFQSPGSIQDYGTVADLILAIKSSFLWQPPFPSYMVHPFALHIPAPPSGQPPLEMKKRENSQPGTGWENKWAPQPQEWGLCSSLTAPQITHSVFPSDWNGKERHRYTPPMGQLVLLSLQSLRLLSTSLRGAGISQAALARREDSAEQCQTCWQWDKATITCLQKFNLSWVHHKSQFFCHLPTELSHFSKNDKQCIFFSALKHQIQFHVTLPRDP